MGLLEKIEENAIRLNKKIVLPEGEEERTLKAAEIITDKKIAQITLIGNPDIIKEKSSQLGLKNIDSLPVVNPISFEKKGEYVKQLVEIRKNKGLTEEQAEELLKDPLYIGIMMIKAGDVDGEVAGAVSATGNVLRPALQIIKTKPGINVVSSCFLMILPTDKYGEDGVLIFSDCAVVPDPNAKQLGEIAVCAAESAKNIAGIEPRVGMLSFSSKGSAKHPDVDKVIEATKVAKELAPDLLIDGELQVDSAICESVAAQKCPDSPIKGRANVLVFPDLDSGNIGYKLTQRLANAQALGPLIQGLNAPVNDLSRGCSVEDIVNLVAITANQAGE